MSILHRTRPLRQNVVAVVLAAGATAASLLALLDIARGVHVTRLAASTRAGAPRPQSITIVHLPRESVRVARPQHLIRRKSGGHQASRSGVPGNVERSAALLAGTAAMATIPVAPAEGDRHGLSRIASSPKARVAAIDAAIRAAIQAHNDSAARSAGRRPGDWTITRGKKRYGMEPFWLHLGSISIPVPIQFRATLYAEERDRGATGRHDEIIRQARRAEDAAMFQQAVRDTRLRIDQQRQALGETERSPSDRNDR